MNYPTEGFDGDVAGRSFHNGRFVQRLRQAAASVPSITIRQGIAKRLLNGAPQNKASSKTMPQSVLFLAVACQSSEIVRTARHHDRPKDGHNLDCLF